MKITNEHQLPDAFLNFAKDDKYSKGDSDISVTTLIDSPRIRLLREKKKDEMTKDVVDMIWPLLGTLKNVWGAPLQAKPLSSIDLILYAYS